MYRIGHGYDSHRIKSGNGIHLGTVFIDCEFEFIAHSDGDVAVHSLIDAMFGALALGDIGAHFPDTDSAYAGASGEFLLSSAYKIVRKKAYKISNADISIIAERPKLRKHIDEIRASLAKILDCELSQISIKASTNEGLDSIGRGEAIAAHSVCLLIKQQ